MTDDAHKIVYWHRDLPPINADASGEHSMEATSKHISGTLSHGGELWHECYEDLLAKAEERLRQEVLRLGGDYAHVLDEWVDARHDDATSEAWLSGRFKYTLYRRPRTAP